MEECTIDIKWLEARAAAKYPTIHRTASHNKTVLRLRNPALIRKKDQKEMLKTNKLSIQKVCGGEQQIEMHKKRGNSREEQINKVNNNAQR